MVFMVGLLLGAVGRKGVRESGLADSGVKCAGPAGAGLWVFEVYFNCS